MMPRHPIFHAASRAICLAPPPSCRRIPGWRRTPSRLRRTRRSSAPTPCSYAAMPRRCVPRGACSPPVPHRRTSPLLAASSTKAISRAPSSSGPASRPAPSAPPEQLRTISPPRNSLEAGHERSRVAAGWTEWRRKAMNTRVFSPDIPILRIDPFDEAVLCNPEPYYAELRAMGPLVNIERYGILACGRYKETQEILCEWPRFVSSRGIGLSDFKVEKPWRPPSILLEVDPPEHSRTRTVMSRAMSPRAVATLKEGFRNEAEKLIDQLLEKREFDAVRDLAEVFPLKVFPDAVGIAEEGRETLLAYGAMVFNAFGPDNEV